MASQQPIPCATPAEVQRAVNASAARRDCAPERWRCAAASLAVLELKASAVDPSPEWRPWRSGASGARLYHLLNCATWWTNARIGEHER
jgi:hypothetical protein